MLEAAAVGDQVPGEVVLDDGVEDALQLRVERGLAAGERHLARAMEGLGLREDLADEREGQILGLLLGIAQAVLAVELAAVGQVEGDPGGGHVRTS